MDAVPKESHLGARAPVSRIKAKAHGEPRDERVRIPQTANRMRPEPLNLKKRPIPDVKSQWSASSTSSFAHCESPKDPEIVDIAIPKDWPRRGAVQMQRMSVPKRNVSPSVTSQYSTRQSEMSFGILDYYISDCNSSTTPEVPPLTPKDPAMDNFDFGLASSRTKSPRLSTNLTGLEQAMPDAKPGASTEQKALPLIPLSPPMTPNPQPLSSTSHHNKSYSLFPTVKEGAEKKITVTNRISPPPASSANIRPAPSNRAPDPIAEDKMITIPLHRTPNLSYRPRKESITNPFQSRKDSFTSFRSSSGAGGRIPMRVLSSSTYATDRSSFSATATPPHASVSSRWSDDTITSPTAASRPAIRGSFGSLLGGRESAQYPACFFDDDDDDEDEDERGAEATPLRRKFGWKRSGSIVTPNVAGRYPEAVRRGRFDEKVSFGRKVRRFLLCGCGGR